MQVVPGVPIFMKPKKEPECVRERLLDGSPDGYIEPLKVHPEFTVSELFLRIQCSAIIEGIKREIENERRET